MADSGQPPERSLTPKEPVRIVYHAQNRTFARLFKERSLDQVKDVVRRKLGLGPEIDVSLKQMGPDALLDLDDDDDFQAFRVLVRSSVTVDIQVTVGGSQGASVSTHVAPQPQLPAVAPSVSLPSSSSLGQASAEAASVAGPSAATKKTPGPSARKRKVSFGDTPVSTPAKPTEQHTQPTPVAATPASSAKAAETPAATKSTQAEEPPKKKQKKDTAKTKDAQPTEGVETPATKASAARKPRVKKTAASDRGTEAATSVPKGGESSELPAKKSVKRKKDAEPLPKTFSAPADPDGMDQPISQPNAIHDTSVQLPSEGRIRSGEKDGVPKIRQDEKKIGACAAIPRTSASMDVQSEITAAILAGRLPTGPPPPPTKRKSVKRGTKKSLASSSTSLSNSMAANASSNGAPNASTEPGHEQAVTINKTPLQPREPNGPRCPICLGEPFHIRYLCPTVLKGAVAIRDRLEEVKKLNAGDQQPLIRELEDLLRDKEVAPEPPSNATPPHEVQSQEALQPLNASGSRTPNVPDNSNLSEVVVENRDEGSSSESSDDVSEGRNKHSKEPPTALKRQNPDKQPLLPTSPPNDVLEAIIRGPALRRPSISRVLDRIEDEERKGPESEVDGDEIELEEDREEVIERSSSQLSKRVASSSETEEEEEEEEEEESLPPSPSLAAQDNLGGSMQGSHGPVEKSKSTEDLGHDIVMENGVDPSVTRGQEDGSSEETHVGSEDHMEVDDTVIREKGVGEKVPSPSKASFPEPSDEPNDKPQSRETEVDLTVDGSGRTPAASEVPHEADPIEPADDMEPPTTSRTSNSDPIEVLPEDAETSTPRPGVTKRIKTRDGRILDDEAERPVFLEEPATSTVTPLPTKGKSRKKVTEMSASQEQGSTRRRTRSNSLLPSTGTLAAVTSASQEELIRRWPRRPLPAPATVRLWDRNAKAGTRSAKTPAKRSEQQADGSQTSTKGDRARNAARIAPSPSLVNWETLTEPLSPSIPPDEPSVQMDELMSSSQPEDNAIVGSLNAKNKNITPAQKERLFDLSSSQIPFPYSQHKAKPAPTFVNGAAKEAATESDSEQEARTTRKKARPSAFRTLSQLAFQAVHFSPSLPTPSVAGTKTRKPGADKYLSSSSSSSDEDEANKSTHIPRERRAGAKLETRKRKSILSRV